MDANMHFGELVTMPDVPNLTNLLDCPICKEIPCPPIYICAGGHSLCHFCKSRVAICPLCQSRMTTTRNFLMEDLISNCTFTCMYEAEGCPEIIKGGELKDHLDVCQFRVLPNQLALANNDAPANNPGPAHQPALEENLNWREMVLDLEQVLDQIGGFMAGVATKIAIVIWHLLIALFILYKRVVCHYYGTFFGAFLQNVPEILYNLFILTAHFFLIIFLTILPIWGVKIIWEIIDPNSLYLFSQY